MRLTAGIRMVTKATMRSCPSGCAKRRISIKRCRATQGLRCEPSHNLLKNKKGKCLCVTGPK